MSTRAIPPCPPATSSKPQHHPSHRGLLSRPDVAQLDSATIDAIIVPTARSTANLQTAIDIAGHLGCPLVALCSRRASVRQVYERAHRSGIQHSAIDIAALPTGMIPSFATTELLRGTPFELRKDTSLKRNAGLLFAYLVGWKRVVFLDDDIAVPQPRDLRDAVALLDRYEGVGLFIGGFPDNSVVCHAYRDAGGPQDTFIGGGALAVDTTSIDAFFPDIYNEDWFFLLDDSKIRPSALTGLALQSPYDPFTDVERARSQELGDCLAEGVFSLLDQGGCVQDANTTYWKCFLDQRRQFINDVMDMVIKSDEDHSKKARMVNSLEAAGARSQMIDPTLCVKYLTAWRSDCARWSEHARKLHQARIVEKVLCDMGLMSSNMFGNVLTRT